VAWGASIVAARGRWLTSVGLVAKSLALPRQARGAWDVPGAAKAYNWRI
jgi:hypothetical protein